METMHAAGRRKLPPVPRPVADHAASPAPAGRLPDETPVERTMELVRRAPEDAHAADEMTAELDTERPADVEQDATDVEQEPADVEQDAADVEQEPADVGGEPADVEPAPTDVPSALDSERLAAADEPEYALDDDDPAQDFVTRLRAAGSQFATAAGAENAVVREAVPPARHRRSRCRIVLRYADGGEADLTFLGAVGRPGTPAWQGFDEQIQRWLGTGQQRQAAWLVEDTEAPDGVAVDVPAWVAAG